MILGGLISDKERTEAQGIPYLRDIPWLGGLFDWKSTSHEEINLVIMLTPYIVRSDEDISKIHSILADLDQIQDDYQTLIERKLEERLQGDETDKVQEKKSGNTQVNTNSNLDLLNSTSEEDGY